MSLLPAASVPDLVFLLDRCSLGAQLEFVWVAAVILVSQSLAQRRHSTNVHGMNEVDPLELPVTGTFSVYFLFCHLVANALFKKE